MKKAILMIMTTALMMGCANSPGFKSGSKNPYMKPDQSWISISGTVVETGSDEFTLDYGRGIITVEMDDWGWYNNDFRTIENDRVTVYGMIDADMYETTTIEARSVYDQDLGTYFYASADDEYGQYDSWFDDDVVLGQTIVKGKVSGVGQNEFTIDTGRRMLTVNVSEMSYNPLDDKGFHRIDRGDYVRARGDMDVNFWAGRTLMADSVITLKKD